MAAANVDGLGRAVASLSREAARADGSVRELQQAQQDLRTHMGGKAGINELQAVAQGRASQANQVRSPSLKV